MQVLVGAYLWEDSAKVGRKMHQPPQPNPGQASCRLTRVGVGVGEGWGGGVLKSSGTLGRPKRQEHGLQCAYPTGTSLISCLLHGAGGQVGDTPVKKLEFLKLYLAVGHSAVIVPSDSLKLLGRY